jgi:hypothetical protein
VAFLNTSPGSLLYTVMKLSAECNLSKEPALPDWFVYLLKPSLPALRTSQAAKTGV